MDGYYEPEPVFEGCSNHGSVMCSSCEWKYTGDRCDQCFDAYQGQIPAAVSELQDDGVTCLNACERDMFIEQGGQLILSRDYPNGTNITGNFVGDIGGLDYTLFCQWAVRSERDDVNTFYEIVSDMEICEYDYENEPVENYETFFSNVNYEYYDYWEHAIWLCETKDKYYMVEGNEANVEYVHMGLGYHVALAIKVDFYYRCGDTCCCESGDCTVPVVLSDSGDCRLEESSVSERN